MKKKQIRLIHIGKKCPKGWKEVAGSVHLGKGIWALNCVKEHNEIKGGGKSEGNS